MQGHSNADTSCKFTAARIACFCTSCPAATLQIDAFQQEIDDTLRKREETVSYNAKLVADLKNTRSTLDGGRSACGHLVPEGDLSDSDGGADEPMHSSAVFQATEGSVPLDPWNPSCMLPAAACVCVAIFFTYPV